MLFADKDGPCSRSQIAAFEDTREWNIHARSKR
jgi:hypothetical protein